MLQQMPPPRQSAKRGGAPQRRVEDKQLKRQIDRKQDRSGGSARAGARIKEPQA